MSQEKEDAERDRRARVAFFRAFLYCGGSTTLTEWRGLAEVDRSAFIEASAQVEAGRAARIVEAFTLQSLDAQRDQTLEQIARAALATGGG